MYHQLCHEKLERELDFDEHETPTEEIATIDQETIRPIKIGVPWGLFFFKFFPLWKAFLEYLHCEVVVSPATTTKIIEEGAKAALSELCVPMKIFLRECFSTLT